MLEVYRADVGKGDGVEFNMHEGGVFLKRGLHEIFYDLSLHERIRQVAAMSAAILLAVSTASTVRLLMLYYSAKGLSPVKDTAVMLPLVTTLAVALALLIASFIVIVF